MPMPSKSALLVVAGLSLTTAASSASGIPLDPPGPDMSLYSTSPAFIDGWGTSIAMGNGFIVVGAPNDDTAGPNRGSVSVIWVDLMTGAVTSSVIEIPAGLSDGAAFGNSVAAYDNKFVVAAPAQAGLSGPVGAVWVYEVGPTSVTLEEVLQPTSLLPEDLFAQDVDINYNRVIVGSPSALHAGSVWVFDNYGGDDWSTGTQLVGAGNEGDGLGWSVAFDKLDENRFAASAPFTDVAATPEAGEIQIFEFNGTTGFWNSVATLDQTMMGTTTHHLGNDLDFDSPHLLVGEFEHAPSGRAHLFSEGAGWSHQQLTPDGNATILKFGSSVALYEDFAMVGAMHSDFGLALEGAAYLYRHDGAAWNLLAELMSNGGTAGSMGKSVALFQGVCLAGAPGATESGAAPVVSHGNVQFWSMEQTPGCPTDVDMDGETNVDDIEALLTGWGACGEPMGCPSDVDRNNSTDMSDLIEVLMHWGSCL